MSAIPAGESEAPPGALRSARAALARVFSIDARSLAAFRIGLGAMVLADLLLRARDLRAHYTADGVVPGRTYLERWATEWSPSIHFLNDAVWYQALLFLVAGLVAVTLIAGYRTRLATCLSWFLLISLHARNPYVLQAGDVALRLLLFWGMFLPLGLVWSVDARRRPPTSPRPLHVVGLPTAALLLQIGVIYWFSALSKCNPMWLSDRTGLFYALHMDDVTSVTGRQLLRLGGLLPVAGLAVVLFEGLGPFLAFSPLRTDRCRTIAALLFIGMHALFALCFHIGLFSYVMMLAWVPLLPGGVWQRFAPHPPAPDAAGEPSTHRTHAFALPVQVVCVVLFTFVVLWNVATLAPRLGKRLLPPGSNTFAHLLRLDQTWNMFAMPYRDDGWWVAVGELPDGRPVDVLRGDISPASGKPRSVAQSYPTYRWRKYLRNLWDLREMDQRRMQTRLAEYLCTRWNGAHDAAAQVSKVDLVFMMEFTGPHGPPESPTPILIVPHVCGFAG